MKNLLYSDTRWALALLCAVALVAPLGAQDTDQSARPSDQPAGMSSTNQVAGASAQAEEPDSGTSAVSTTERPEPRRSGVQRPAVVVFGRDAELKKGDTTDAVVVIGGSAVVHGRVRDAVVAIGGDVELKDGAEASQAVAVLGGIKVAKGSTIHGEAVAVGGKVDVEEGATVEGQIQDIELGGFVLPKPEWLRSWFRHCVLMVRPVAPQVGWVWGAAGAWFLFYLLIAAAFPRPVGSCVDELQRRPATTMALGILSLILIPLVFVLLAVTGLGLLVVPFLIAALFLAAIVGKVGLLEWIGLSIGRPFRAGFLENPLVALLIGSIILLLLYMIPVLGLLLLLVTGVWGLGAAVGAAFGGMRREMPPRKEPLAPVPPAGYGLPVPQPAAAGSAGVGNGIGVAAETGAAGMSVPPPLTGAASAISAGPALVAPVLPEALQFPRASFWERMGAAFLDVVLVSIIGSMIGGMPLALLVALAYFAGMWGWKGTTIGGIVLGLKVVRLDGPPVTFAVAIVRALAAAFSTVVLFLGFLWIAWDKEKQGWHDRIAGTVVIKLPRGTPLVCL